MKRIALTLAMVLVVAACGDNDAGQTAATTTVATTAATAATQTTTTAATETPTTTAAETTTTEGATPTKAGLVITSVSFVADLVVITNFGTETIDLGEYWLCQRPTYAMIPPVELAPGEFLSISLGGAVFLPIPGSKTIDGPLNVGALAPSSGELALYSSNSFGSSDAIVSYIEWGDSNHGRSSVAVGAGIWPEGGFVPTTPETGAVFATTQPPVGPDGYEGF